MMNMIAGYFNHALKSLKEGTGENKKTWAQVKLKTNDLWVDLSKLKFIDPKLKDGDYDKMFTDKLKKMDETYRNI